MVFFCHRHILAATTLSLLSCVPPRVTANAITTAANAAPTVNSLPATCEFRTINYITDSLPQQCLRSAWSQSNSTSSTKSEVSEDATGLPSEGVTKSSGISSQDSVQSTAENEVLQQESSASSEHTASTSSPLPSSTETSEPPSGDTYSGELNDASFLSFEEWKKQTLEKAGQENANIGNKKSSGVGDRRRDSESIQNSFDSLGDEGEIDLDFGAFRSSGMGNGEEPASQTGEPESRPEPQDQDEATKRKGMHRSHDAGKTYKERFSYASFDAGATILKTHPGAKNAKAVLIENKDSYMLTECAADNKFLIVELSEDIWIDTLVLANFEFFSSMFRSFRVSVSDLYPVKMEKWKDIGTYEARNSREIQAFLIENPQIWARYIRIEFLSHYGNEYYCPLSLIRVHGTRMLESWKETEAIGDEDESEDNDGQRVDEQIIPDAVAIAVQEEEKLITELREAQVATHNLTKTSELTILGQAEATLNSNHLTDINSYPNASLQEMTNPWIKPDFFNIFDQLYSSSQVSVVCQIADTPTSLRDTPATSTSEANDGSTIETKTPEVTAIVPVIASVTTLPAQNVVHNSTDAIMPENSSHSETPPASMDASNITSDAEESIASATASLTNKSQNIASQKNRTTNTSSAASSLPTIQESFFKAVSRRLQLLEANSTLSLKYIEEQSKILREAFTKVEKKQLQKTDTFLDTLNSTVLAELRRYRQQYDEIWQSTVISLESQREESKREILAVSTRLNILADEVVFQKRMSIVQSVLLLLCLGLIIFSRVFTGAGLDFQAMQTRARNSVFQVSPSDSPVESPSLRRMGSMGNNGQWLGPQDGRQRSGGSPISMSRGREDSPPTPVSSYSRSENGLTPPSGGDDPLMDPTGSSNAPTPDYLQLPGQPTTANAPSMVWREQSDRAESVFLSPSSAETPRSTEGFVSQQASTPASGIDPGLIDDSQTSVENATWIRRNIRSPHGSPHLLSPPPESESEQTDLYITGKPLPALPHRES